MSFISANNWMISADERAKHSQQFQSLKPVSGFVTGAQAKGLFMKSGLPGPVLAQVWQLADLNADGRMDLHEFSIAMFLIKQKLSGQHLPAVLPQSLKQGFHGAGMQQQQPMPNGGINIGTLPAAGTFGGRPSVFGSQRPVFGARSFSSTLPRAAAPATFGGGQGFGGGHTSAFGSLASAAAGSAGQKPVAAAMPHAVSAGSLNRARGPAGVPGFPAGQMAVAAGDWSMPQTTKLKYNQMFNCHDNMRTGYLTGGQARSLLTSSGLSQPILAHVWQLADVDADGRLSADEFCLAMHLVDLTKAGRQLPKTLPSQLLPANYQRKRGASLVGNELLSASTGSSTLIPAAATLNTSVGNAAANAENNDTANMDLQNFPRDMTLEDKRKDNFEKSQLVLQQKRQALEEMFKKEQEDRERKERQKQEQRERIRQEEERKRQQQIEKQLAKQKQAEQDKEEQRRKVMEQREAARKEMERQRQTEWERQRRQELELQKRRETEAVASLKANSSKLALQYDSLAEKVKNLTQHIQESRQGIGDLTSSIEEMRTERDAKLADIEQLKTSFHKAC